MKIKSVGAGDEKVRLRRSRAQIEALLERFAASEMTQTAFARREGVNLSAFRQMIYRSRSRKAAGRAQDFVPVCLSPNPPRQERAVVRMSNGVELEAPVGADAVWIAALVREICRP